LRRGSSIEGSHESSEDPRDKYRDEELAVWRERAKISLNNESKRPKSRSQLTEDWHNDMILRTLYMDRANCALDFDQAARRQYSAIFGKSGAAMSASELRCVRLFGLAMF
jgi:hypothetical protein